MDWGSVFNWVVNFMIWLVGCLRVIGCLGGLAFLFEKVYLGLNEPKQSAEEKRCEFCKNYSDCPARPGVVYPCPYFESEVQHDE